MPGLSLKGKVDLNLEINILLLVARIWKEMISGSSCERIQKTYLK